MTTTRRTKQEHELPQPWEKQKLHFVNGWVGVTDTFLPPDPAQRTMAGGWVRESQWQDAYMAHCPRTVDTERVGRILGAEEAWERVNQQRTSMLTPPILVERPRVKDEDIFASEDLPTEWGRATGKWYPPHDAFSYFPAKWKTTGTKHKANVCAFAMPMIAQPTKPDRQHMTQIDMHMRDLTDTGHIRRWNCDVDGMPSVVTNLHAVEQNGGWRVVTDLRGANSVVGKQDLSLPRHMDIANVAIPGSWMMKCDLRAGYYHLSQAAEDAHLLCFWWRGEIWTWNSAPMGLRDSPGAFQARTRTVIAILWERYQIRAFVYLDDIIMVIQPGQTRPPEMDIIAMFTEMGMVLGRSKCSNWSQRLEVLGLIIDTTGSHTVLEVPEQKQDRITHGIRQLKSKQQTTVEQLAKFVGLVGSVAEACRNTYLLLRPMYDALRATLGEDFEIRREQDVAAAIGYWNAHVMVPISDEMKRALRFMSIMWHNWPPRVVRRGGYIDVQIRSDASEEGVGGTVRTMTGEILSTFAATLRGDLIMQSSMVREASGFRDLIRSEKSRLKGKSIMIVCDNEGLIRRHGKGTTCPVTNELLLDMAWDLWDIGAEIVQERWWRRSYMEHEDELSRPRLKMMVETQWFLRWSENLRDPPTIDLFASRDDTVIPGRYCSADVNDNHSRGEALTTCLDGEVPWCFPPLPMIRAIMRRFDQSGAKLMYICVPAIKRAIFRKLLVSLQAELLSDTVRVQGAPKAWRFEVWMLSRPWAVPERGLPTPSHEN